MKHCKCGCGNVVKKGNIYINGHNKSTLGKPNKNKGKTYKEIFGEKKSKEISDKIRKTKIGEKNPAKRTEVRKKISKNRKGKLTGNDNPNYWKGKINKGQSERMKINNPSYRDDVKEKIRKNNLKRWIELGSVKIGKNETQLLNYMEEIIGYKILRQHSVSGYSVDGYIKELNLVIEIDEKHHYDMDGNLKDKDIKRQNKIEEKLCCKFLRIKDNINIKDLKKELFIK
jgi:very-short-patch-repair endonuclease